MKKLFILIFSVVIIFNANASSFEDSEFLEVKISCADQEFKVRSLNWYSAWDISASNAKWREDLLDFPMHGYDQWACIRLQGEFYLILKGEAEQRYLNQNAYYSECIRVFAVQRLDKTESLFSCDNNIAHELFQFLGDDSIEPFHESYRQIKLHKFEKLFTSDVRLDD
jgi:hypothetical protein